MPLQLELFAVPSVLIDGVRERIRLNKPSSLLFHLAYRADWVSRSELAFLYRSDVAEVEALNYLRKLIFRAKKYPWASQLEVSETHLRWLVDSDVKAFKEAFKAEAWQDALALYKQDFLAGSSLTDSPAYMAWLELERADLLRQKVTAQRKLIADLEAKASYSEASRLADELIKQDAFDEGIVQMQLRLRIKDGREKEATELYAAFSEKLKAEFDAEPLESTQLLMDSIVSEKVLVTEKKRSHNLPAQTTRFVGRRKELEDLGTTFKQDTCRLLTLLGLGGTGKTRLALEFSRSLLPEFADGVFWVSLAAVQSAQGLVPTIAVQLGLVLEGQKDLSDQLFDFLADKELLLFMDNFEHLLAHAELLEAMLHKAPKLRILVTSREALKLKSEYLFDLAGLQFPAKHEEASAAFESVDLFLQRASRVSNQFVVSRENLEAVASICRLVEGMPLAIELAATWVRSLAVTDLAAELASNIDLLELSSQKGQGLKSVFDYAWQGLTATEQSVFCNLAVFQGGFDLQATKSVAGAHLSMLMMLLNRSLLRRDARGRYSIHELLRQYALLHADNALVCQRHAEYFIELLGAQEQDIQGYKVAEAMALVDLEYDNVLQAWRYAREHKDIKALSAGLETLYYYYYYKGYFELAADDFLQIQALLIEEQDHQLRAKLLARAALFQRNLGRMQAAESSIKQALKLIRKTDDVFEESNILCEYGKLHHLLSQYQQAEGYYLEAVELAKSSGNTFIEASVTMALGDLSYYLRADIEKATLLYKESLKLFHQLGEQDGINAALLNLGAAAFDQHDLETARQYYEEAYEVIRNLGQGHRESIVLNNLGAIDMLEGKAETARIYLNQSLDLCWQASDKRGAAEALNQLARLEYQEAKHQAACEKHLKALALFKELGDQSGVAYSKSHYSRALFALAQGKQAEKIAKEALELAFGIAKQTDILTSLLSLAYTLQDSQQKAVVAAVVSRESKGGHEIIRQESEAVLATLDNKVPSELPELSELVQGLLNA